MDWIRKNKFEFILLLLVLLIAIFLRFYRIADYMTFMGDEGRDALIVRDIIVSHRIPLVGPPISFSPEIGGLHLGPLYYYMMAVSMALSGLSPVGAAVMVALFGVLSVALIYYLSGAWFGKEAALLAGFAYATSPAVVAYSRSSWNPNLAPFFALLAILGAFKSFETRNFRWFILTGGALAFAVQMHYLSLILIPVAVALWGWNLYLMLAGKDRFHSLISGTMISVLLFLALMSPLFLYDIRHGFTNFKAVKSFFYSAGGHLTLSPFENLQRLISIYSNELLGVYMAATNTWLTILMSVIVIVPLSIALALKLKGRAAGWPFGALALWLLFGLIGMSLYRRAIYPHYLGFLSPVPFLLLGGFIYYLPQRMKYLAASLLLLALTLATLPKNPLMFPPANQLERAQKIALFVIKLSENRPYNFAILSEHNYDAAYQFYLAQYGHRPKSLPADITEQLLVVCEDSVCQPTVSSKDEIALFGPSVEVQSYDLYGVKVYKLSHNPKQ